MNVLTLMDRARDDGERDTPLETISDEEIKESFKKLGVDLTRLVQRMRVTPVRQKVLMLLHHALILANEQEGEEQGGTSEPPTKKRKGKETPPQVGLIAMYCTPEWVFPIRLFVSQ